MNKLKATREAKGMRREALAAASACSFDYIRRLESDDPPNPTIEKARAIARALGATVDKVFPPATEPAIASKGR